MALVAAQAKVSDMFVALMLKQPFSVWATVVADNAVAIAVCSTLVKPQVSFGRVDVALVAPASVGADDIVSVGFRTPALMLDGGFECVVFRHFVGVI